jgi:hypothetical protein
VIREQHAARVRIEGVGEAERRPSPAREHGVEQGPMSEVQPVEVPTVNAPPRTIR